MDSTRFVALLESHRGIVFRVVRTYCRHSDDGQDLAQEIRLQLWRAFGKYDERRAFSTWMYRIALNVAISWSRGVRRDLPTVGLEDVADRAVAEVDDDARVLYSLIEGLDPMNRALLLLVLDDLSHAEIGEIMGISAGNVATKVSRLKQRLRQEAAAGG